MCEARVEYRSYLIEVVVSVEGSSDLAMLAAMWAWDWQARPTHRQHWDISKLVEMVEKLHRKQ